jgi:hypothetical protein
MPADGLPAPHERTHERGFSGTAPPDDGKATSRREEKRQWSSPSEVVRLEV